MKSLFLIAALLLSVSVFAQGDYTGVAKFKVVKYSFGKIKKGTPVTTTFTFTNSGTKPLIVENAEAGCGCTKPEYPKAPIMAGKTGTIKVTYDAATDGNFTKNVNVKFAGEQIPITLLITGEVVAAK